MSISYVVISVIFVTDYVMDGPSRLTCVMTEEGAMWSGDPPVCSCKCATVQCMAYCQCHGILIQLISSLSIC